MKKILNLGSGVINLLPNHYLVTDDQNHATTYSVTNADIIEPPGELPDKHAYAKITVGEPLPFSDDEFDVVLAISPFGFSLINKQTVRVLKPDGVFILIGNGSNPWSKAKKCVAEDGATLVDKVAADDQAELRRLADKIKDSYISRVSDGSKTTVLNLTELWSKK